MPTVKKGRSGWRREGGREKIKWIIYAHSVQCTEYTVQNLRNRNYLIDCYRCCSSDNWLSKIARSVFPQFRSTTRCVFHFCVVYSFKRTLTLARSHREHMVHGTARHTHTHTHSCVCFQIYQLKSQKFCLYFHVSTVLLLLFLLLLSWFFFHSLVRSLVVSISFVRLKWDEENATFLRSLNNILINNVSKSFN